jgi:hypothetical protein
LGLGCRSATKILRISILEIPDETRDQRVGLAEGKQVAARKRFGFKTQPFFG